MSQGPLGFYAGFPGGGPYGPPGELFNTNLENTGYTYEGDIIYKQSFTGVLPGNGFFIDLAANAKALLLTFGYLNYAGGLRFPTGVPIFPNEVVDIYINTIGNTLRLYVTTGGPLTGQPFRFTAWFTKL